MNDTFDKKIKERVMKLERKMAAQEKKTKDKFDSMRKDIDRFFDGTEEKPGIFKRLDRLEEFQKLVLEKLDKLDHLEEIVELLKKNLKNNRL